MPFTWTDGQVRAALGLELVEALRDTPFTGVTTDTRTLEEGELFVALVGDNFDGHDFVGRALEEGAGGAVVSRSIPVEEEGRLYPVEDTLVALGDLARHRRRAHDWAVVGITGSSGKTTTKELTRAALEERYRVHANPGNLNNRIGLPLTLLSAPEDAGAVVVEMGTNEPGEIAELTRIAEPHIGVLTTISEAHLEKLGSLEGVYEEKLALLRGLPAGGRAVVGDVPEPLPRRARLVCDDVTVVGWTDEADPDFRPEEARADASGCFTFRWRGRSVELALPGRHAVRNALLALAVARFLDVSPADAARGIARVSAQPLRGERRRLGDVTLLVDCYNANPQSVAAALELLASLPGDGARIAVLGTMLELGEQSDEIHARVLEDAVARELDLVVATGAFAGPGRVQGARGAGDRIIAEDDPERAYELLRERMEGDETVLLKGSRGVALERLIPLLEKDFAPSDTGEA